MDIEYYKEDERLHFKFSNFKRKGNNDVYLHQPNIRDGGWIIEGNYNLLDGKYYVGYYKDGFICSEIQDEIAFDVGPKKEYIVYFDDKKRLRLKGGQFTRTYRKPTPEKIQAQLKKEAEERQKRQEDYHKEHNISSAFDVLLPDHSLPLVRLNNPQMVRDKIFTEFLKETSESDSVHYVTKSSDSWQKVPSLDGSVEDDLARIRSEAAFVNAMTMRHSQEETLESSEQLGKIISSEPTDDRG